MTSKITLKTKNKVQIETLMKAFLDGKSEKTIIAYKRDLEDFRDFLRVPDINQGAKSLLSQGHGQANLLALNYRNALIQKKLSPATINRRLSALRSMISLANMIGMVNWKLVVKNVPAKSFRDTKGCGLTGFSMLLKAARNQRNEKKKLRDIAILYLLFSLGCRRGEVGFLDLKDVDLAGDRIWIKGKGRNEKEPLTLPDETKKELEEWIKIRGTFEGPLFINVDRAKKGLRLTDSGIYRAIRYLGKKAGFKCRTHSLRHAAVSTILDLTNGNLRLAQSFARHKNPATTILYDDNRLDASGEAAKLLAKKVKELDEAANNHYRAHNNGFGGSGPVVFEAN